MVWNIKIYLHSREKSDKTMLRTSSFAHESICMEKKCAGRSSSEFLNLIQFRNHSHHILKNKFSIKIKNEAFLKSCHEAQIVKLKHSNIHETSKETVWTVFYSRLNLSAFIMFTYFWVSLMLGRLWQQRIDYFYRILQVSSLW